MVYVPADDNVEAAGRLHNHVSFLKDWMMNVSQPLAALRVAQAQSTIIKRNTWSKEVSQMLGETRGTAAVTAAGLASESEYSEVEKLMRQVQCRLDCIVKASGAAFAGKCPEEASTMCGSASQSDLSPNSEGPSSSVRAGDCREGDVEAVASKSVVGSPTVDTKLQAARGKLRRSTEEVEEAVASKTAAGATLVRRRQPSQSPTRTTTGARSPLQQYRKSSEPRWMINDPPAQPPVRVAVATTTMMAASISGEEQGAGSAQLMVKQHGGGNVRFSVDGERERRRFRESRTSSATSASQPHLTNLVKDALTKSRSAAVLQGVCSQQVLKANRSEQGFSRQTTPPTPQAGNSTQPVAPVLSSPTVVGRLSSPQCLRQPSLRMVFRRAGSPEVPSDIPSRSTQPVIVKHARIPMSLLAPVLLRSS